jgi:hypothetical protein
VRGWGGLPQGKHRRPSGFSFEKHVPVNADASGFGPEAKAELK